MRHFKHELVFRDFTSNLQQSRRLVFAARQWTALPIGSIRPRFTILHRNLLIEMAFLRCFLAWERFLEESFILYLLGKKPLRRRHPPRCRVSPSSWSNAFQMMLPEVGPQFVDWVNLQRVRARASRFFVNGEPFETALTARYYLFGEMQILRNAIAHRSQSSQNRFHSLVQSKLSSVPPNITAGTFLETAIAGSHPPQTYLDQYLDGLLASAMTIVP
jgi:hypothetical protein